MWSLFALLVVGVAPLSMAQPSRLFRMSPQARHVQAGVGSVRAPMVANSPIYNAQMRPMVPSMPGMPVMPMVNSMPGMPQVMPGYGIHNQMAMGGRLADGEYFGPYGSATVDGTDISYDRADFPFHPMMNPMIG